VKLITYLHNSSHLLIAIFWGKPDQITMEGFYVAVNPVCERIHSSFESLGTRSWTIWHQM